VIESAGIRVAASGSLASREYNRCMRVHAARQYADNNFEQTNFVDLR
jgi:hypothetical protein